MVDATAATAAPILPPSAPNFSAHVPVLIVGGGGCGLTAALAAHQAGAEVLVLERDASALGAYAKIAGPAMAAGGGRFLVRGEPATVWEAGKLLRTVVVEFDDTKKCIAAYDGPAYAEALRALGSAADRDRRVVEGVS